MPGRDSGAGARRGSAKRATEPSLSGTAGIRLAARSRDLEVAGELPAHRDALDAHVVRRCDVARRALQVIRHRPVILVAMRLAHHVGDQRGYPAQLRMSEGVAGAGVGEELAVRIRGSLGDHDYAVTVVADALAHAIEEFLLLERHFRKQDDVGRFAGAAAREAP